MLATNVSIIEPPRRSTVCSEQRLTLAEVELLKEQDRAGGIRHSARETEHLARRASDLSLKLLISLFLTQSFQAYFLLHSLCSILTEREYPNGMHFIRWRTPR